MSWRETAVVLFGREVVEADWADDRGVMKDGLKHLVTTATGLRDGGYLVELLGGRPGAYLRVA